MAARTRSMTVAERAATLRRRSVAPVESFRPAAAPEMRSQSDRVAIARVDGWLLAVIAALCAFGLVMVYSASEALGYEDYGNPNYFFERQILWLGLGIALMLGAMRLDYHRWRGWAGKLALLGLVLLLAVLVPHIGTQVLGARRWIVLGPLSVQPSTLATLICILAFSKWLCDRGPAVRSGRIVRDFGLLLIVVLGLVILEKDLGSTMILAGIGVVLIALAGARKRHLVLLVGILGAIGYFAVSLEAYRSARVACVSNPFADPLNACFQMVHSLYALGSGGFTGVGLGHSIEKYQWLPEAHTDFIFAIIGEELGLVGTLGVVGGFVLLAWRGVRTSLRAPDTYGALVAGGITAWICVQAFLNIAAVTNLVPTTGVPLPFISYGGSSLAMTLLAVGILCNISAQGRRQGVSRRAHVDRWRGNGGTSDPRAGGRAGVAAR
ncbi:MAG TPA: putative lipid II flippase FtsW [Candidatus Dormibacteraeota bacterium]|nr:putative lipid II flippase FtsW [Candidatus Dormibacteraeota bacterium]